MDDDDNDDIRDLGRSLQDLYNEQLKAYDAFDAKSQQLGQNHPGNDTIHRSKKSAPVRFRKGGMVCREYAK